MVSMAGHPFCVGGRSYRRLLVPSIETDRNRSAAGSRATPSYHKAWPGQCEVARFAKTAVSGEYRLVAGGYVLKFDTGGPVGARLGLGVDFHNILVQPAVTYRCSSHGATIPRNGIPGAKRKR